MATIDRFKEGLVVGIEYVIKLKAPDRREPSHHCVLSDKKGDPNTIAVASTIYIHRSMFLVRKESFFCDSPNHLVFIPAVKVLP